MPKSWAARGINRRAGPCAAVEEWLELRAHEVLEHDPLPVPFDQQIVRAGEGLEALSKALFEILDV
jgi:hypothetical protein